MSHPPHERPYRQLSNDEFRMKIEKGLCFRCDEKYHPSHRCNNRQIKVMITLEEEENEEAELKSDGLEAILEEKEMELTMQSSSVNAFHNPKTMKVFGKIRKRKVLVLLDSGVVHSFVSCILVEELSLPTVPTRFKITLGDDKNIKGVGRCPEIELKFQGIFVTQEFFSLELGEIDMILGVNWLCKLGEVRINWKLQTMKFQWQGKRVRINNDLLMCRMESTLKALVNSLVEGGEGLWIEYRKTSQNIELNKVVGDPRLNPLL